MTWRRIEFVFSKLTAPSFATLNNAARYFQVQLRLSLEELLKPIGA